MAEPDAVSHPALCSGKQRHDVKGERRNGDYGTLRSAASFPINEAAESYAMKIEDREQSPPDSPQHLPLDVLTPETG
jgi:hypothetical protein